MMSFIRNRNRRRSTTVARGVYTIRKGIGYLQAGDFESALNQFRKVVSSNHRDSSGLVKSVASFYYYNTERFRKEFKKANIGNAHLMDTYPVNSGDAWSDVDIAAVLIAPTNGFTVKFLAQFLGRTEEAVRFQRRYAFGTPLASWVGETGNKYTRYTQTKRVTKSLRV